MPPRVQTWAKATATVAILGVSLAFGADAGALIRVAPRPVRPVAAQSDTFQEVPFLRHALQAAPALFVAHPSRSAPRIALMPSVDAIPSVALTAYELAAAGEQKRNPSCHLPWRLIAAIGYIESDHGQFGGDVVNARGREAFPIEGIPLNGAQGIARIPDGHGGFARAEGPMQFIPSTWATWGADGNGDHRKDPQNIFDATAAAADYLCSGAGDLSAPANQPAAITRYNDSPIYVKNVMAVERAYEKGKPASTVALIPMPTTAACPAGTKKAKGRKVCVSPKKHGRDVDITAKTVAAARMTSTPAPTPSGTPAPVASTPSPSPTPSPTPTPTATPSATPTPWVAQHLLPGQESNLRR